MYWRGWLISAITIVGAVHATASLAQSPIGSAASVQNQVQGIIGGGTQSISAGGSVFQNERVRTGDESQAQLVFLDQTNLGVGPKSEVTLNRFVYNPDRGTGRVAIEASRGVFRFVTGSQDPKNYEVNTPIATIQVRGTEFHLLVARNYIVVALVHGALRITTVRGRVVLHNQPSTAVTIHADGRVEGPMPWTGPFTRYAGDVPFPYFTRRFAAFFPVLGGTPGALMAAPRYNWTGCYAGGNGGYSWGRSNNNPSMVQNQPAATAFMSTTYSYNVNGVIGGGQVGCNWQPNQNGQNGYPGYTGYQWLVGVEADFQGSNQKGNGNPTTQITNTNLATGPDPTAITDSTKLAWFGTVRGRAGVVIDRWLAYVTGGFAYGKIGLNGMAQAAPSVVGPNAPLAWSQSMDRPGWVIGAGVENAISTAWSWKLEYLYMNFGTVTANLTGGAGNCYGAPGACQFFAGPAVGTTTAKLTDSIVRLGLNYKFN